MFDIRSDEWVFMSIPAQGWKYRENRFAVPKDYKNYPDRMVTHGTNEPSITCSYCLTEFSTDSRRKTTNGDWSYVPVTKFITYCAAINKYRCLVPCMSTQDYTEKARQEEARERSAFLRANRHLM